MRHQRVVHGTLQVETAALQVHVIRILWMVPIYAITSCLALRLPVEQTLCVTHCDLCWYTLCCIAIES